MGDADQELGQNAVWRVVGKCFVRSLGDLNPGMVSPDLRVEAPVTHGINAMSSELSFPEKLGGTRDHDERHPWVGLIGRGNSGWSYATWRKGGYSTTGNPGLAYTFATREAALAFATSFPFGGKRSAKRLTVLSNPTSQGDRYWRR